MSNLTIYAQANGNPMCSVLSRIDSSQTPLLFSGIIQNTISVLHRDLEARTNSLYPISEPICFNVVNEDGTLSFQTVINVPFGLIADCTTYIPGFAETLDNLLKQYPQKEVVDSIQQVPSNIVTIRRANDSLTVGYDSAEGLLSQDEKGNNHWLANVDLKADYILKTVEKRGEETLKLVVIIVKANGQCETTFIPAEAIKNPVAFLQKNILT